VAFEKENMPRGMHSYSLSGKPQRKLFLYFSEEGQQGDGEGGGGLLERGENMSLPSLNGKKTENAKFSFFFERGCRKTLACGERLCRRVIYALLFRKKKKY